jgi:hypothetical protein
VGDEFVRRPRWSGARGGVAQETKRDIVRARGQRHFQMRERFGWAAQREQRLGEVGPRFGEAGVAFEGLAEMRRRFLRATHAKQCVAEVVPGRREFGGRFRGAHQHGQRLGHAVVREVEVAQVVERLDQVWLESERLLVGGFRIQIPTLRLQGHGEIELRGKMRGVGFAGAGVGRTGLRDIALPVVRNPFREEALG